MGKTLIEWTDYTFNGWTGCTKISPGCQNCYAEGWAKRSGIVKWGAGNPRRRTSESNWKLPVKWNREAGLRMHEAKVIRGTGVVTSPERLAELDHRPRVFCASLADWLDDEVPIEWLADLLELIHATPNLDWLLLTKRPENWEKRMLEVIRHELSGGCIIGDAFHIASRRSDKLADYIAGKWKCGEPPPNVWVGTTVENQAMADKRIPLLLSIPAKVRFLSCEPLLEPVTLPRLSCPACGGSGELREDHEYCTESVGCPCQGEKPIHWAICGGESGPNARQFHSEWARAMRDQCKYDDVAFFMKQMGGTRKPFAPIPDDLNIRQFPQ